jgi:hypothetical protein
MQWDCRGSPLAGSQGKLHAGDKPDIKTQAVMRNINDEISIREHSAPHLLIGTTAACTTFLGCTGQCSGPLFRGVPADPESLQKLQVLSASYPCNTCLPPSPVCCCQAPIVSDTVCTTHPIHMCSILYPVLWLHSTRLPQTAVRHTNSQYNCGCHQDPTQPRPSP